MNFLAPGWILVAGVASAVVVATEGPAASRLLGLPAVASKSVGAVYFAADEPPIADRLVVLDAGKIVEEGTHAQLLATGGHYAQLWERQSGGFLDLDVKAAE